MFFVLVDFFILPNQDDTSYLQFISTQIRSYYEIHKTLVIYAEDAFCCTIDKLLWFDQEDYFLPHAYIDRKSQEYFGLPVILVSDVSLIKRIGKEILIDLTTNSMPINFEFKHLVKIVDQELIRLNSSRHYYKALQQQGFIINVHKL